MAQTRKPAAGTLTLAAAQYGEAQVDYSYDQWRHAQMRQMERSYDAATGQAPTTPAAA
jgi:hypothetical protein